MYNNTGVIKASKKSELVMAKNMEPKGDRKKRTVAATVTIPVRISERGLLSSSLLLGGGGR